MNVSTKSTFYYHADSSAIGGIINQPFERVVSSHASLSLAQAGGISSSPRVEGFEVERIVSARLAHARVWGNEDPDRGYRSVATATVEGFNVLDVVTADRLVAQVSIMHPYDNKPAEVSLFGSQFVNLQVNGSPVNPVLDQRLFGAGRVQTTDNADSHSPSFDELLAVASLQYTETADDRKRLVALLGDRFALGDPKQDLVDKGSALCSLVKQVTAQEPIQGFGRVLHIPDFGNIFLGELCLSRFAAELTMVRVELGCTAKGSVSAASSRSNGRLMP